MTSVSSVKVSYLNQNLLQIRELIESFEGPQPADVRLMKRKTGESS